MPSQAPIDRWTTERAGLARTPDASRRTRGDAPDRFVRKRAAAATRSTRATWLRALALVVAIASCTMLAPAPTRAGAPGPAPEPAGASSAKAAPDPVDATPTTPAQENANAPTAAPRADVPVRSDVARPERPAAPKRPVLDPSARLLDDDDASEAWTIFVELETGHRVTQRFLLTNTGPGEHNAVAVGHLVEDGRAPYRYENGRRRSRWTLSDDRRFFDIAASHLDLHRPQGQLRITKDDIEIRLFFDFAEHAPSARVPASALPPDYHVEVLAMGAATHGTLLAPWMDVPLETRGRTWLVHTWTPNEEARVLARRAEFFAADEQTSFYGIQLLGNGDWSSGWAVATDAWGRIIESPINVGNAWRERVGPDSDEYPAPAGFDFSTASLSGEIALEREWLRFDPLEVIPQPFRWFIRRRSQPREVWADARIGVSLSSASGTRSLPLPDATTSAGRFTETSRAQWETDEETSLIAASGGSNGVASITFLNPVGRR